MENAREMPRYKCHKEVRAVKIQGIVKDRDDFKMVDRFGIVPSEPGLAPIEITREWMAKHQPQVGGYYVVYADGYASYSPAKDFEDGYTRV